MSNEKTNERWYKSENRLFHADTVTNKSTGEVVEISNSLEKLYAYMLNQYRFWSGLNQQFAESQERLGTVARIGDAKKKTKPQIDKLIALGLVEITGKVGRCNIYKVIDVDKVAGNLEFSYPEWAGEPMYDHEKRLGKSSQQPKNEEKKGNGEQAQQQEHEQQSPGVAPAPATNDPQQRSGVSQSAGDSGDDVSGSDAMNERYYADLDTLNHWVEGHDDEGFTEYGVLWGITKPGAITDLIKSHIRKIQSDGYKGSRSAANDDRSSADVHYKQRQEQAAAEAKRAVNAPDDHSPPDFNDDEEF
ncbi:TPA: hypothetical protein R5E59_002837 [Enterobacter cloacae]|jgi:hypothetical protein|nr:hypothetical protein [Enterobacter cloacae]HED5644630.1 hypothetical protein [Enterobacter cloacae]